MIDLALPATMALPTLGVGAEARFKGAGLAGVVGHLSLVKLPPRFRVEREPRIKLRDGETGWLSWHSPDKLNALKAEMIRLRPQFG